MAVIGVLSDNQDFWLNGLTPRKYGDHQASGLAATTVHAARGTDVVNLAAYLMVKRKGFRCQAVALAQDWGSLVAINPTRPRNWFTRSAGFFISGLADL